jgi:hypothetical protein
MSELHGIKNTKEVLIAMLKIMPILVKQFKDGVQVQDALEIYAKIMADEQLKLILVEAFKDYQMVEKEVKDLDAKEVVELIMAILPEIMVLLEELKNK